MGYTVGEGDYAALTFLIGKVEDHIKNYCYIEEIPEALEKFEIEAIATEFLSNKALYGGLDETNIVVGGVSSVTEGDVTVSYATSGGETISIGSAYQAAKSALDNELITFRRLRW